MRVKKRDGSYVPVKFDEILSRVQELAEGLNLRYVDPAKLAAKVVAGLFDGVTTEQLDRHAAEVSASMVLTHPDYGRLAARIEVSNLHKKTSRSFSSAMKRLYTAVDEKTGAPAPLISSETWRVVKSNAAYLDSLIQHERDFDFDFFGFRTLEKSYLMKVNGQIVERPQYMLMRVAIGIHGDNLDRVAETYELMSQKYFTHATPTLFNAGTPKPQMSSCFLLMMKEDSIDGIYDTLKQCAKISQSAGGIGVSIHNVRAKGSYIRGTGGTSNGIVPMLRNFDMTARYVDQGGGRRKGSIAIYLEPWHADVFDFLELKKNHGKEELRARDLFYALWIPDLFMKRVENNDYWTLMCPNECPGLSDVYGDSFELLYEKYESQGKGRQRIKAQDLWFKILDSQIETGTPYILFKDAANRKSNQKNLGTIKSSNLCTEIMEYTSPDEVAVCNLASIALNKFVVVDEKGIAYFDHARLKEVTKVITVNLNQVIDRNYYPIAEAKRSNLRHRPVGIGVQGLADTFILMRLPFDSPKAKALNREIFETIYYAAVESSMELAQAFGPYETYPGSPISKGIFQFDMWGVTPASKRYDWERLRELVKRHGVRNSLLLAPMPTASTSQILGNNECFEPYTSNTYNRRVLSGEFIVVNAHLLKDLISHGLWNESMRQRLIYNNGSIQDIPEIPKNLKELYRTVWEIKQKDLIDMAADRAAYICQSQSMNLFVSDVNHGKLTSMHFYAWKKGLKTGIYYLRTNAAADAIKFTVDKSALSIEVENPKEEIVIDAPQQLIDYEHDAKAAIACSLDDPDNCVACGS